MNKNKFNCLYCNKIYKTKSNLDKHTILCLLIYNSKTPDLYDDEDIEIPSQKNMYKMLIELANKYTILEKKYEVINKRIPAEIKKINIITWLNDNYRPIIIFDNLIDEIQFTDFVITELFKRENFYILLNKIINKYFNSEFPIISFEEAPRNIYIFNNLGWEIISKEILLKFLNKLHLKIYKYFCDWKNNNNKNNDKVDNDCDKITILLMNIDFKKSENAFFKAKSILSKNIRQNIKTLIEYDFEY
jgi:hypothetical protein